MKKIIEKLVKLEVSLAKEKGPFDLFALFLREDGFDKWDLVASAMWIEKDYSKALDFITKKMISALTTDELLKISKVVLIDEFDERVKSIQKAIRIEHKPIELRENNFFGLRIDLAYVITSKIQADKRLTKLIWEVLTEMWSKGEDIVDSSDVLKLLEKRGEQIAPGSMRRVFDFLLSYKCIRAAKYIDRDAIKEHGAMTITSVSPYCSELESYFKKQELTDLLRLDGEVFDLHYEKWILQVDNVFEHQGPLLTYSLNFINLDDPNQQRKLNLTISYQSLAIEKKDRYNRPDRLWKWMYGWLFDKRPIHTVNYEQDILPLPL